MHPGILDRAGCTCSTTARRAVWTSDGWVAPRPAATSRTATCSSTATTTPRRSQDLNQLTGPSPLLPEYLFGVWYSDYYAYTTSDYENTLIPDFRANHVPLDNLSVDTDWKSPQRVGRLGVEPGAVPRPAGVPRLGQLRRASTSR